MTLWLADYMVGYHELSPRILRSSSLSSSPLSLPLSFDLSGGWVRKKLREGGREKGAQPWMVYTSPMLLEFHRVLVENSWVTHVDGKINL